MDDEYTSEVLSIRCTGLIKEEIDKLAKKTHRSRAQMGQLLWIEALEHRGILDRTHTKPQRSK